MKMFLGIKILIGIAAVAVLIFVIYALLILYLTITEYRPKPVEKVEISGSASRTPEIGKPIKIVAWNIGYGSLDAKEDFFMDGGKMVRPATDAFVKENMAGIKSFLDNAGADLVLLQEVDTRSFRSYYVDEAAYLEAGFGGSSAFAPNFVCKFVPFPIPPIGEVKSGLLTMSAFAAKDAGRGATRIGLPVPFKWPVRIANLKRALLVERLAVAGSDKELVIVNLHLEAYSSGTGRDAQMRQLVDFLKAEYDKGNYCIAGGDFNQSFPGIDKETFRLKNKASFVPGELSADMLPAGWQLATDTQTPSSRLNNTPYSGNPETTQLYVIDGYIISPNVEYLSVKTADLGFRHSDHNPVEIAISLKP
jgi:endonuclease/exonuclease/phosphatase family metal-dependent hydrolase